MAMKRTTVYADEDDLAVVTAAEAARGVAEAEHNREGVPPGAGGNRGTACGVAVPGP